MMKLISGYLDYTFSFALRGERGTESFYLVELAIKHFFLLRISSPSKKQKMKKRKRKKKMMTHCGRKSLLL